MKQGRLGYNSSNGRYGLLSSDLWIDTGFHCGEGLEVLVGDEWVQTRMEMNLAREWYLVGTPYCGDLEYYFMEQLLLFALSDFFIIICNFPVLSFPDIISLNRIVKQLFINFLQILILITNVQLYSVRIYIFCYKIPSVMSQ